MIRNKLFQTAAAGIVLAAASSGVAHAVPSYAYASLSFTNFTLNTGSASLVNSSVTSTDSANYPSYAPASNSMGGDVVNGTDPAEATSGPGAFPGQNVFTQAMLPASSLTPAGTRGDVQITGALATGATSNLVSEGKLSVYGQSAGSSSGTSTTLNETVTAASNTTVTLTFNASSMVQAIVGTTGDSANAQLSATYKIVDTGTGTAITITDNINNANSGTTIAPFALNENAATTVSSTPQTFSSPSTAYSYTATLLAGHTYQISLQDSTTVLLQTAAAVPEPASLSILGSGMVAVGLLRARRKKSA